MFPTRNDLANVVGDAHALSASGRRSTGNGHLEISFSSDLDKLVAISVEEASPSGTYRYSIAISIRISSGSDVKSDARESASDDRAFSRIDESTSREVAEEGDHVSGTLITYEGDGVIEEANTSGSFDTISGIPVVGIVSLEF
tara:strand:- start:858 stop:1286 length:429 start_codon:yes stop_codon:yes gene_type:complete